MPPVFQVGKLVLQLRLDLLLEDTSELFQVVGDGDLDGPVAPDHHHVRRDRYLAVGMGVELVHDRFRGGPAGEVQLDLDLVRGEVADRARAHLSLLYGGLDGGDEARGGGGVRHVPYHELLGTGHLLDPGPHPYLPTAVVVFRDVDHPALEEVRRE